MAVVLGQRLAVLRGGDRYVTGSAIVLRGHARALPLADESVDLVVTSPPYFALRSYTDGGETFDGQIGSERTPAEYLDALLEVTAEAVRVLKPSGSLWINIGDKYASRRRGPNDNSSKLTNQAQHRPTGPRPRFDVPQKSLLGLPWRYANRVVDELGLVLREDVVWSKPNGLPESVTDRCRRSHEYLFHFTREARYFAAMDEVRGDHSPATVARAADHRAPQTGRRDRYPPGTRPQSIERIKSMHPAGALPPSVWTIATEPLVVPEWLGVDHFAAFPTEIPRRLILGWCPPGGVALDPFGGTGTTALVAKALGRVGISIDLSADYCRLAQWRINHSGHDAKVRARTWADRQGALL